MGRMHSNGKGISSSALPYKRSAPSWCKSAPAEVRVRAKGNWGWEALKRARAGRERACRERARLQPPFFSGGGRCERQAASLAQALALARKRGASLPRAELLTT